MFSDGEGPNKPNSGTNSTHANKAVRMKHRAQTIDGEDNDIMRDFPKDHDDEEGPMTVREMVTIQR